MVKQTPPIILTEEQLRTVVIALQELPFRVAAPVLKTIEEQVTKESEDGR